MQFKKAERRKAKLKLAITGPSGSGKTYSSLELATGLGGKIALIDTENASASLYADRFEFDTLVIEPPYTIDKYAAALKAAESADYEVLIIDSISHAWAGEGGLLSKKEALDARGGNSFANWGSITKEQEAFKSILLNANLHLICTMRSKQDYVLDQNGKGRSVPRKVGLAPIQRDGMEYEFTTVFDVAMDHNTAISKDRTGLFDGKIFKISAKTGKALVKWLNGAAPEEMKTDAAPASVQKQVEKPSAPVIPITPPQEPSKTAPVANPGDFVITFTKGFKGKKISEVKREDLNGLVQWCIEKDKFHDLIAAAEAYWAATAPVQPIDELDAHLSEEMPSFEKFK